MKPGAANAFPIPLKHIVLGLICVTPLSAAPGGGKGGGGGNTTDPGVPTPYVTALDCTLPGTTRDINSITVNSPTSLTINISVGLDQTLGTSNLTITNPDGQSATSIDAVVCITDVPVINSTSITPTLASTVDDVQASVTEVTTEETTFPVTYEYAWLENGVPIGHNESTLPATLTSQSCVYVCQITPVKNGSIRGNTVSTAAVTVTADFNGNGIHDEWEESIFGGLDADPTADNDNDGLSNRAEYLFGLDPSDPTSNSPIVSTLDPSTGVFEYRRAVNKIDGVTYRIETSPDLSTWTVDVGATQAINSANANSEVVRVGLTPSLITSNNRLFVRVNAE